jgi:hypothetical protein
MKHLTLHCIVSSLHRFIASVAHLWWMAAAGGGRNRQYTLRENQRQVAAAIFYSSLEQFRTSETQKHKRGLSLSIIRISVFNILFSSGSGMIAACS